MWFPNNFTDLTSLTISIFKRSLLGKISAGIKTWKSSFWRLGSATTPPGIVKFSFWRMTAENPKAIYACVNLGEAWAPGEIAGRAICIDGNIGEVFKKIKWKTADSLAIRYRDIIACFVLLLCMEKSFLGKTLGKGHVYCFFVPNNI